jgi:nicotinamidase/pyrazinamidase
MDEMRKNVAQGDALLLIDVQRDFCAGGALEVQDADSIVLVLNGCIEIAVERDLPVYASRDWHPLRHVSFREQGGDWPPHCLADSEGALFHPDLAVPDNTVLITKGVRFDQDQNSVFDQTGFARQLRRDEVLRLWVGGLALDVCVLASVLDAVNNGFAVNLLAAATRPVTRDGGEEALRKIRQAGVMIF